MALYRLTLELAAPLGTPLAGPTLFGQICWLKRETDGEAALVSWLGDPARIWRISDGFPHGCLPKPLCRPSVTAGFDPDHKARKKRPYVTREGWFRHRAAWDEARVDFSQEMRPDPTLLRRLAHNVVDRHGRGTLDEGGLYFADEDWRFASDNAQKRKVDLYVEAEVPMDEVRAMLALLGDVGFGRDASTGRGRWQVVEAGEDRDLTSGPGKRRMTLTRGILTPRTMRDALWRIEPHFGRAGPQLALAGSSPFKRPVLLIRPGASFTPAGGGPFGAWLTGVHPEHPEVGINGLHITIPLDEATAHSRETAA